MLRGAVAGFAIFAPARATKVSKVGSARHIAIFWFCWETAKGGVLQVSAIAEDLGEANGKSVHLEERTRKNRVRNVTQKLMSSILLPLLFLPYLNVFRIIIDIMRLNLIPHMKTTLFSRASDGVIHWKGT